MLGYKVETFQKNLKHLKGKVQKTMIITFTLKSRSIQNIGTLVEPKEEKGK